MESAEHSYFLGQHTLSADIARVIDQSTMFEQEFGLLAELTEDEITRLQSVLDVGCGPGHWLIALAAKYPHIYYSGIDINPRVINYAEATAGTAGRQIVFQTMDATKHEAWLHTFVPASFDLVNMRLGASFLRTGMWGPLLQEFVRVTSPGGYIRLTETDIMGETNSQAWSKLQELSFEVFRKDDRSFPGGKGVGLTPRLRNLLTEAGVRNIQEYPYQIDLSSTSQWHTLVTNDMIMAMYQGKQWLINMGAASEEELHILYEQAREDLLSPDLRGHWDLLCLIGRVE